MRGVLLELVRPLAERFAGELVDLLVADVERRVAQLGEAFDVALSTFAAELAHDVRDAGPFRPGLAVPEAAVVAEQASTSSNTHGRPGRKAQQTSAASDDPAEGLAGSAPRAPGRPSTRSTASASGVTAALTTAGKPRQRAVMKCKTCGRLGSRSDGCGTSHEPLTASQSSPPIAAPTLDTPPLHAPAVSMRSATSPRVAKLPSANATNGPAPSFDVEMDRREEHQALSSLTTWRKSHG